MNPSNINRRAALGTLGAASAALAFPALAQSGKIVFGYTAVTDFASVFVAAEQGYFTKRKLDVELKFIPLNSTIPAAIQSDSLQMGGPTPSVYLQSVDGGLDHVVVAGGGITSKTNTGFGLVAKAGSGIRTAQDCIGKKVGVPGLGAFLHVTFRAWLKQSGVDYKKVNFVEASFPQHGDLLRGGSIDAVVSADPFMSRIVDSGVGYVASYYATFLEPGNHTILYTAKRDWAQKNAAQVKLFREAVQEAAAFIVQPKNDAAVRDAIAKYTKLPAAVVAKVQISPPGPTVSEKQMAYWVGLMKDQGMLQTEPKVATLIFK
ncbi:MAG: ABC transporter substrate-binding protein [Pseudomonadota bacterium]